MAKRPRKPTRHNALIPRGIQQRITVRSWHQRYPEERYAGTYRNDPYAVPASQRRRPPTPPLFGVLPDIIVLCGRPKDGVPCSGVIYQLECYVCGSRDRTYRTAYRRAGADALAARTDKMSEGRR